MFQCKSNFNEELEQGDPECIYYSGIDAFKDLTATSEGTKGENSILRGY